MLKGKSPLLRWPAASTGFYTVFTQFNRFHKETAALDSCAASVSQIALFNHHYKVHKPVLHLKTR